MNPRIRPPLLAILAVLCVAALVIVLAANCKPAEPTVSPTLSPTPTPPPTSTPVPTWTPTPTPTPAPELPVLAGTPVPLPRVPIMPENAADMVELAMWGRGEALNVTYSPDGRLLAVGTTVGIWLYDTESLDMVRFIPTKSEVDSLAFTSDSTIIFARSSEISVAWWDVTTGELLGDLEVGEGEIAFSLDSARLVAVAKDRQIELWDIEKGEHLHTLEERLGLAGGMTFSPDGTLLAIGPSADTIIRLWAVQTGKPLRILEGHTERVGCLAFSPDGSLLASGSADDTVRVWDVEAGASTWILEGHGKSPSSWINAVAFSSDGATLASGAPDSTVQLWNARTGAHLSILQPLDVQALTFSPNGKILASVRWRGQDVQLWDVETGTLAHTLEGSSRSLGGPIISPDGTVFVSHDNTIEQLDLKTGRVVRTLEGHTSNAGNLALSADGTTLASSETWDLAVWIWDVDTGAARRFPGPYATFVRDVALSPDGSMFAASSDSNAFFVYDTESGEHVRAFGGGRSCKLTFSADGTKLLSAAGDGIYLWSVTTGKQLLELPSHYGARSIALSPDGSLAVIGGAKSTIRLYDTASGQLVRSLEGSTGHIYGLAFSPGGALLASGGQDRMVRLWDARAGTLLESLEGHTAAVRYLSFLADGAVLGSGGNDGTVRLWGVPPAD